MRTILTVLLTVSVLCAGEKKIKKSDLPEPVAKAADQASQGGQIIGFAKETEKGQTFYEMELKVNGKTKDVTFDAQGNTITLEEEVPMDSLPSSIQEGLKKSAGSRRITLVEKVTKGSTIYYEAHLKGWPSREITIGSDGNPLSKH